MRAYAHRIDQIDFNINPSFNVMDQDVVDLIEDTLGIHYSQAGYKFSVRELDELILASKDSDPMLCAVFKRDRRWAELHSTDWVSYTIVGDIYDGEPDADQRARSDENED